MKVNSWARQPLGDLVETVAMGPFGSSIKKETYRSSGVPVIKGSNLNDVRLDDDAGYEFISSDHADKLQRSNAFRGDVVVTHRGTLGQVSAITEHSQYERYIVSQSQLLIRPNKSKLSSEFLSYYLRSHAGQFEILSFASQTGVPAIAQPSASIRRLKVSIPPLREQKAIAAVLGALDDKIAANTKLAATCENLALSLLHSCSASVPVGEIVTYKRGSIDVSALGESRVAHFSLPAFDNGRLPELCDPNDIKSNKAHVEAPSVLISKLNPRVPRVWNLLELPSEPAVASTEFLVLEPKFSSTSVLWAILSQEKFGRELETQVAGTSGSHQRVRPADLLATKTIDPRDLSSETQHQIMALCQTSYHSRYENRQLEATRDALLPQLMSGKLRVKDAEEVLENAL